MVLVHEGMLPGEGGGDEGHGNKEKVSRFYVSGCWLLCL